MDVPVFVGIDEQARVGTLQLDARVSLAELAAVKPVLADDAPVVERRDELHAIAAAAQLRLEFQERLACLRLAAIGVEQPSLGCRALLGRGDARYHSGTQVEEKNCMISMNDAAIRH